MSIKRSRICYFFGLLVASGCALAQDQYAIRGESPENFKVEASFGYWRFGTTGSLHDANATVDLRRDLGMESSAHSLQGSLVWKPGRKHRIVFEASPIHLTGRGSPNVTFTYNGQTFIANTPVDTDGTANMYYFGYQYDFFSGAPGHLGVSIGADLTQAKGTLTAPELNETGTRSITFPVPLPGLEGRLFLLPHRSWLDAEGYIRGVTAGSYGHLIMGRFMAGVWIANHFGVHAGYQIISGQGQDNTNDALVKNSGMVDMKGPVFTVGAKF